MPSSRQGCLLLTCVNFCGVIFCVHEFVYIDFNIHTCSLIILQAGVGSLAATGR